MQKLRLLGTSTSHFARKVRIVLHELGIRCEFELVRNLLEVDAARYGQNPLLRVPTLIDGDRWIIESDHIARYVVSTRASHDPLNVLTPTAADLNQLAVLNGVMTHEVTLIMAAHSGLTDVMSHTYFKKLAQAMSSSLSWLDRELDTERAGFNYVDVATICMWEHLVHYGTVRGLQNFQRIARRVTRFSERDSVAGTIPSAFIRGFQANR